MPQSGSSYNTKQKTLILDCFKKNVGVHLTIDEIYSLLKESSTPVGISTLYRNVKQLVDEGVVTKYSVDNESGSCYQYNGKNCKSHFHLKCTVCMKLIHASCEFFDSLDEHVSSHHGFTIDKSRTVFYGVCRDCLREGKKL